LEDDSQEEDEDEYSHAFSLNPSQKHKRSVAAPNSPVFLNSQEQQDMPPSNIEVNVTHPKLKGVLKNKNP
jgi:hypothetical protein